MCSYTGPVGNIFINALLTSYIIIPRIQATSNHQKYGISWRKAFVHSRRIQYSFPCSPSMKLASASTIEYALSFEMSSSSMAQQLLKMKALSLISLLFIPSSAVESTLGATQTQPEQHSSGLWRAKRSHIALGYGNCTSCSSIREVG